ncbi:MAG TPA: N,N-dimethylformamidase beta subunit family domain-containing protein, partial [Thermoanaerobaculia bacterium]|nr:N,N-dimethylformamidase beta subunit family domain-containing protein [Thermoanaerobaculia bacterium]
MKRTSPFLLPALLLLAAEAAEAQRRRVVTHPTPVHVEAHTQGGYADRASVIQGQDITFHIATSVSPFALSFVNLNDPDRELSRINNLTSRPQDCSGRFRGCGWDATATLRVPRSWPSGYYAAKFPTAFGEKNVFFVVRAEVPASESATLLIAPTHTYQAYNRFGGASLYYDYNGRAEHRASYVSYERPYDDSNGLGRFDYWEHAFIDWMQGEGRRFEAATDVDLEDPTLLSRYKLVVLTGHSEYWTARARENLETYHRNGGHIAVFGGNTMWWQVRLEDDNRTIVGFKQRALFDPVRGETTTTHWYTPPVHLPENLIFGASFRNGGYANKVADPNSYELLPVEQRTGWTVTDSNHWIFQGTGVTRGSTFGRITVGLEVDGA